MTAGTGPGQEFFRIDGFDFGIEPGSGVARIHQLTGALHVEVEGAKAVMEQLFADDMAREDDEDPDSWTWILYPPRFNVEGVGFDNDATAGLRSTTASDPGPGCSEVYIYAIAHRRLDPFAVTVRDGWVGAQGSVHGLFDDRDPVPFELAFRAALVGYPAAGGQSPHAIQVAVAEHYGGR